MRGIACPKDGVLSHAYDPRIHDELLQPEPTPIWIDIMDCRTTRRKKKRPGVWPGRALQSC